MSTQRSEQREFGSGFRKFLATLPPEVVSPVFFGSLAIILNHEPEETISRYNQLLLETVETTATPEIGRKVAEEYLRHSLTEEQLQNVDDTSTFLSSSTLMFQLLPYGYLKDAVSLAEEAHLDLQRTQTGFTYLEVLVNPKAKANALARVAPNLQMSAVNLMAYLDYAIIGDEELVGELSRECWNLSLWGLSHLDTKLFGGTIPGLKGYSSERQVKPRRLDLTKTGIEHLQRAREIVDDIPYDTRYGKPSPEYMRNLTQAILKIPAPSDPLSITFFPQQTL
jgi:hypothetical protein